MNTSTPNPEPVQLTNTQAIEYRRFVQRIIQKKHPQSSFSCSEDAVELNRLYLRLESAFRRWVSESVPTVHQRILKYSVTTPVLGIQHWNYRELDVVCGSCQTHVETVIELKAPNNLGSKSKTQLRKSLNLIHQRWPEAQGFWINLYLGEVLGKPETKAVPRMESCKGGWKHLMVRYASKRGQSIDDVREIWMDGKEFVDHCISEGWLAADFCSQLQELHQAVHPAPNPSFRSSIHQAPINPLSDSLNKWISKFQ